MVAPDWAYQLLDQVCKDEGRNRSRPKLNWGYSKVQRSSSGHYSPIGNTIRVLQGTSGHDHKQVFLHEICHWLTKPRGGSNFYYGRKTWHGKRFYLKLNQLLTRYDCYTQQYQERENRYMKRSVNYL